MRKQAVIVGLGQFGMSVAKALSQLGAEVLAVDRREDLVHAASQFAAEAVVFDATDEAALAKADPQHRDLCVCAIGNESRDSSIICTTLLRQLGAPRVVARASDAIHARILHLVGAHEVVTPERDFGERFARRALYEGFLDELPLGDGLMVTEVEVPDSLSGKSLAKLDLRRRHGITVVAIKRGDSQQVIMPKPEEPLREHERLVVVSHHDAVHHYLEKLS